jgi:drug/metabolite transporter (DMT)-like permease
MLYLAIVSMVWAVSFGLIKGVLSGVDSSFAAAVRLLLALLVFLPFLRLRVLKDWRLALELAAIGAVQYGLMYLLYMRSFTYLQAHEVALFTCLTPVFVTLLDDAEKRRFHAVFLLVAALAAGGMALAVWPATGLQGKAGAGLLGGLWLVQGSNVCFALRCCTLVRFWSPRVPCWSRRRPRAAWPTWSGR